jgi:5-formyltetrahydrofolate cyclo-ligase
MSTPDKTTIRRYYRQRRDSLTEREQHSAAICRRVVDLPVYQAARVLHSYLPMRSEVDTRPLLAHAFAQGKRVVVPVVRPGVNELSHSWLASLAAEELEPGVFGTLQPRTLAPAAPGDWDLVLLPLLAFDRRGTRLGYGGGFYDRLLEAVPVPAVGLAFAAQEAEALPREVHDLSPGWIVTEREVIVP